MTMPVSCKVLEPAGHNGALQTCDYCDPIWNAIQAEALAESENDSAIKPWLEDTVLRHRRLEESLGYVLGEKLFPSEPAMLQQELVATISAEPTIRVAILEDLRAIRSQDPATSSYLTPFLLFKGFLALEAYRLAHWLWKNERAMFARCIQSRISEVFGVDIHPAARIGHGVFIDHATGVVIGESAVVGDGVVLLHGVTLGGTGKEGGNRHPKVGDSVLIGAGAQILGNIHIGDRAKIGAGSTVVTSVPTGATVVGVAAREVQRKNMPRTPEPHVALGQLSSFAPATSPAIP
ncbi:serine O-acetyltransferase [Pirellulales bacterium]|nr:serine O-acetyltransferase [Pirellulales bacterium]